jgi:ABC-2 type transport system ATP-binding protein
MSKVIEIEGLTKYYGAVRGEGLSVHVEHGEVFGFLGPNGAGKTTTMRIAVDLTRPDAGWVRVLGLDPRSDGVEVRRRLGYLPGDLALYDRLTGREMMRYFGALRGKLDEDRVEAVATRLHLDLERRVGQLSRGNRQKVGLLQAFAHDPEVLLLDEPTAGLDPLMQQVFEQLVREATARGSTVFLSSHILSEVQEIADRAGIIRDGRPVAIEDIGDLRAKALHEIEVRFADPVGAAEFSGLTGVRDVEMRDGLLRCRVEGRADPLVNALALHDVESLSAHELDLEDLFLAHYGDGDARGGLAANPALVPPRHGLVGRWHRRFPGGERRQHPAFNGQTEYDDLLDNMPDAMLALFGIERGLSLTSPEGYLISRVFGFVLPMLFVVLAVSVGSRAIATEGEQRAVDLLMAQPVSRRGVATEKYAAAVLVTVTVGVASWIVLAISSALAGLAAGLGDLAVATPASVLFALQSGALAFGVGAAVGRRAPAAAAAAVVAVMGFVLESLAEIIDAIARVRRFSPFHFVNGNVPMLHGLRVLDVTVLVALTLLAAVVGIVAFDRRDIAS